MPSEPERLASPPVRAVVFDLDGVIVDTERIIHEVWIETFVRFGCSFELEEWLTSVGTTGGFDPQVELAARAQATLPPPEEIERDVEHELARRLDGLEPLPGVVSWISEAQRLGLQLAVASSSPRSWVEARLAAAGILDCFAGISSAGDGLPPKPAPDLYLDACGRLSIAPHEALAVEDSHNGLLAAHAAGLHCVAVPNAITSGLDLSAADLVVSSLADVSLTAVLAAL